jgi:DNA-binding transcriptional MerR regulator
MARSGGRSSSKTTAGRSTRAQRGDAGGARERGRSVRKKPSAPSDDDARRQLAASTKLYFRIGEVSELTGVKAHVLRYWETEFRWMVPPKSRSKQRLYRKRDIEFVWLLKKLLWDQRYTIAGARQRIQELGLDEALARSADGGSIDAALRATLEHAITGAASPPAPSDRTPETSAENANALARASSSESAHAPDRGDWLGIRAALASMQEELLALRGVLQPGT